MKIKSHKKDSGISTYRLVSVAFAVAIGIGMLLLSLPVSNSGGSWNFGIDALFTATSATCVTGLDSVGIGTTFSTFGLIVIAVLSQLGGIGIMTAGTFFFMAMGRRISVHEERVIMNTLGEDVAGGVAHIIRQTLFFTFSWELAGAAIFAWRLQSKHDFEPIRALGHGVFMSIMAFCNSGLGLFSDSLCRFAEDKVIMLTTVALVVVGGIGFIVHANLLSLRPWHRNHRQRGRLSLHSYIVVKTTALIILVGGALYLLMEWNGTLKGFDAGDKIIGALFQMTSARTAGLSSVDTGAMHNSSVILTMVIMFIGASPGSTGGGIKVTSAAILFGLMRSILRNREYTEIRNRSIPDRVVKNAVTVTVVSLVIIAVATFVSLITEETTVGSFRDTAFEIISAFSTAGLSLGATKDLTDVGKICVIICMYIGRIGPVTLAMAMAAKSTPSTRHFPEENVIIG